MGRRSSVLGSIGLLLIGLALLVPGSAMAGGLELAGTGARGMARGGATLAKAEDANVLSHNPAGLAELRGTMMMGDLNITTMDACVDPIGYYGWGTFGDAGAFTLPDPDGGPSERVPLEVVNDADGNPVNGAQDFVTDPLDSICMLQASLPVPQFGITHRATQKLGIGFGLVFPPVTPSGRWGGEYGVIRGDTGELRPSPVRYMNLGSANIGVFPTLGVGYRITDSLRVGVSLQWGIISVHQQMMVPTASGTNPAGDVYADLRGVDWFVPAAIGSIHFVPMDALDVVVMGKWQDGIRTTGEVDATTGVFADNQNPYTTRGLKLSKIEQAMPWKLGAGIRYAQRLAPRPDGTGDFEGNENEPTRLRDAMAEEAWDIEFDVEYQANSVVDQTRAIAEPGQYLTIEPKMGGMMSTLPFPDPGLEEISIERQWKDQWSLRAGGSWNVLPGLLALHTGAHYETRGVTPAYMNVDFWPVSRVGLHGGVTVRLDQRVDLTFAYGHIMQETIVVAAPASVSEDERPFSRNVGVAITSGSYAPMNEQDAPSDADGVADLRQQETKMLVNRYPTVVNAGRYRSSIDVVAVGIQYHF